jgi:hypothetical protein
LVLHILRSQEEQGVWAARLLPLKPFFINLVSQDTDTYLRLPFFIRADEDIAKSFISRFPLKFKCLDWDIQMNKNIALVAVKANPGVYDRLDALLKNDPEIIAASQKRNS